MLRPALRLAVGVAAVAATFGAASPASASHLQGGYLTAAVTATGQLQGTLTYAAVSSCTLGQQLSLPITVTNPTSQNATVTVALAATRCITGSATYKGSFDVPLDTSTFPSGAPDGVYTVMWTSSARAGGIVNATGSSGAVRFRSTVRKVAMQSSAAPNISSNVANGIGIGDTYTQNLNAFDADGGTISYQTLLMPDDPDAPAYDVVSVSPSGQVTIPASTTAAVVGGEKYIYKVRATDSQGDYSERDVLLKVALTNRQPVIAPLESSYSVSPGGHLSIPFTASDPNSGDTVSVSAAGLPDWATVKMTPGNPATGTLELDPPAGATGTFGFNLDAEDNSTDVVLTGSTNSSIVVGGASPTITRAPAAVAKSATFEFTGGSSYECRIDGGAWGVCSSPFTPTGLADGLHTFEVRTGGGVPATATFTLDQTAPAAPAVVAGPTGATASPRAKFEFTGEPGASFECRLDSGAWAACTSPHTLTNLKRGKHVFEVRQTDAAGNVSVAAVERFAVVQATLDVAKRGAKDAKVTPVLSSTVSASSHSAKLGCRISGAKITHCTVKAYVTVNGKQMLIGSGQASASGKGERLAVKIKLNARGRKLVDRVGGVKATFKLDARAGKEKLKASTVAKMLPSKTIAVPGTGLFAVGSGELTAAGKRYLHALKPQLANVKSLTCVGHTDSVGSTSVNQALSLARAKASCDALHAFGVKATMHVDGAGESRPRATNATAAGRALNRRVEIDLDYR